eukprot:10297175-Karenia_brevis.AAC.1
MAPSASTLDKAVHVVLQLLVVTFAKADMNINWSKGKTECSILYRGSGSTAAMQRWHHEDG